VEVVDGKDGGIEIEAERQPLLTGSRGVEVDTISLEDDS